MLRATSRLLAGGGGVPATMKALLATAPGVIEVREVPTPKPRSGEVLVRVMAAPVNPSDVLHSQGLYTPNLSYPARVGFEGCGVVVDGSKAGLFGRFLTGRTVAVATTSGGSWAQYATAKVARVLPLVCGRGLAITAHSLKPPQNYLTI